MNSGAVKRMWGAYGRPPTDNPATQGDPRAQQFGNPVACVELSADGMVYVCDQANNRIQVFRKNGEFVREAAVAPATKGAGSVWDLAFSRDAQQRFVYVADGQNLKVRVLDRQTLAEVTNFGDGGRQAGKWVALANIVTDSKGNIITGEASQGKRVQRFTFMGMGQVARSQGVVWPGRTP
jgi:DNA-binding beta-propeller fold protein YncE